jgi:hypothetical protein
MHAVIRTYSGEGAKELLDVLEKRKSDVESVIRSVKGFANYSLIRTEDGGIWLRSVRTRRAPMKVRERLRTGSQRMHRVLGSAHQKSQRAQLFFN